MSTENTHVMNGKGWKARYAGYCCVCGVKTEKRERILKGPRGWGHATCIREDPLPHAAAAARSFRKRQARRSRST